MRWGFNLKGDSPMKNLARFTVSCLLVVAILVLSLPLTPNYAAASSQTGQQNNQKAPKAKSGPEVASRVRALNESRRDVRAALKVFENKGHKPKIEDSSALTGLHPSTRNVAPATGNMKGSPFQRASFVQQSGDEYIELI